MCCYGGYSIDYYLNKLKETINESKLVVSEAEFVEKAFKEINNGNFDEADKLLHIALCINPNYEIAHWGKFMVEYKAKTVYDLIMTEDDDIFISSTNYQRAIQNKNQILLPLINMIKSERKKIKKWYYSFISNLFNLNSLNVFLYVSNYEKNEKDKILNYKDIRMILKIRKSSLSKEIYSSASTLQDIFNISLS